MLIVDFRSPLTQSYAARDDEYRTSSSTVRRTITTHQWYINTVFDAISFVRLYYNDVHDVADDCYIWLYYCHRCTGVAVGINI